MQEGDFVRIRRSEKFTAPWLGFARNGVSMQVRRLTLRPGCVRVKVADPLSMRQEWFDCEDLIPRGADPLFPPRPGNGG